MYLLKTRFFLLLLLLSNFIMIAQNYTHVDTVVDKYPTSFLTIEDFAKRIEKDFTTDADKVRAAYYWIANHVQYDYESLRTGRNSYPSIKITDYKNQEDFKYKYYKQYASHVLTYKKGVCAGYSQLLFYTCEYLDIEAKVISGNAYTSIDDVGKIPRDTNHAWNAVYFNDKWNLIDATWSTGNEEDKPNHVDFTDVYFDIAPEKLILSHFPKDTKWQLLKVKKSKKDFYNQPNTFSKFLEVNAELDPKIKGIIRAKTNGFITLRFKQIDTTQKYYYAFVRDQYSKPVAIEKDGDTYVAKIPFKGIKKDRLEFCADHKVMVEFRIIPTR